jgi:hypothetical protein
MLLSYKVDDAPGAGGKAEKGEPSQTGLAPAPKRF